MNYIFRLLIIGLILVGCSEKPSISFSSEIFDEQSLDICKKDPCSSVTILYPIAQGDRQISEKINSQIRAHIIEALFLGDELNPSAKTIEQAATDFILMYRDHQVDIPSEIDPGGYAAEISMVVLSKTENLVSIKSENYQYTGGAHGNSTITFLNFDIENGTQLDISDMTHNFIRLQELAEERFRLKFKIPENENVNYPGFWFPEDQFYLSNNIGFTDTEMIVLYNSYEIAPYAEGPIQFAIPLEEVATYFDVIDI